MSQHVHEAQNKTSAINRSSRLPFLQGLLPSGRQIPRELLAGLTLATLAVPEAMGYASIAGMPVMTGLFTLLMPMVLFALFGSSRHLVVGADSATAAMMAAGLAGTGIAVAGGAGYVALAGVLALMAAGFLLLARIFQLGFLANFLSHTVLVGFLTGVGIQVALSQIPHMSGMPVTLHGPAFQRLHEWWQSWPGSLLPAALSVLVLLVMMLLKRISGVIPGPLLVMVLATAASWALDLPAMGVAVLGDIPAVMPVIGLPAISLNWELTETLLPIAFGMFIVILAQSAATSRAYAERYGEGLSENRDLLGLSLANIGAALSGAFVVNGSPTKTEMVDSAGGRTQLAQLTAAAVVLLVLLFLTGPLAWMPQAVMASVVFMIGIAMIDIRGMKRIYAERRAEFWVATATTVIVVGWGVEQGILMSIMLSLIAHTRHGYQPKNTVIRRSDSGRWQSCPVSGAEQLLPGLVIYRFNHSLYYANRAQLADEVQMLVSQAQPALNWFCLDCIAIDDVDFSAAETLRSLTQRFAGQQIRFVLASVAEDVKDELDRSGLISPQADIVCYDTLEDVVCAYKQRDGIV